MLTLCNILTFFGVIVLGWFVIWLGKFHTPVEDYYLSPEEIDEMIPEDSRK